MSRPDAPDARRDVRVDLHDARVDLLPRRIPTGGWQRIVGGILLAFGVFAALAATPFNGAGSVAIACFGLAGPLLFWGIMLRYLSIIERKLDRLAERAPAVGDTER